MRLNVDPPSDRDLLDRVMEKGIVVEVWDRVKLPGMDMARMRVSVASFQLFNQGRKPRFRTGNVWKVEPE